MNLTEHFSFAELIKTSHSEFMPAQEKEADEYANSLKFLCLYILEPIRRFYGKPLIITSGFRGKSLNAKIGGSPTSQHCRGEAADFIINGISNEQILEDIKSGRLCIFFGQAIKEIVGGREWTHISLGEPYRFEDKCMQIMTTTDGKNYVFV